MNIPKKLSVSLFSVYMTSLIFCYPICFVLGTILTFLTALGLIKTIYMSIVFIFAFPFVLILGGLLITTIITFIRKKK